MGAGRGLRGVRLARSDVIEVIVVAAVFATGMTLLTRAIPDDLPMWFLLAAGIVLVGTSFFYVLRRRLGPLTESSEVDAFFVWDSGRNAVIDVEGYEFASETARLIGYAIAEHAGLREEWESDSLAGAGTGRGPSAAAPASHRIVEECVEYMLLEELSMHLLDFFARPDVDEGQLVELGRDDLADVVAGNRVLDLFSTPPAARGKDEPLHAEGRHLEVEFGEDFMYARLDLHLPSGATIRRVPDGIEVESPVVNVRLRAGFDGMPANLSADFAELYLGDREGRLRSFMVWTEVRTRVKRRAMLLRSTWDYFAWVDEFRAHLLESWSGERYFERIQWPAVRALRRVIDVGVAAAPPSGVDAGARALPEAVDPRR